MTKITNDLTVKGLIFPGSFTASEITSINGAASNNGALIWNSTLSRFETGVASNFVPLYNGLLLADLTGVTAAQGALIKYDLSTNKYLADSKITINNGFDLIKSVNDTGADWVNWQIGTAGSSYTILKRSLGTIAAPTALTSGTKIGGWGFLADHGTVNATNQNVSAEISAWANGDQSTSNHGGRLAVNIVPLNSTISKVILETTDTGEFKLNDYLSTRNDGTALRALYTDATGVLKNGPITYYDSITVSSNSTLGINLTPTEGRIYKIYLNANITITPDADMSYAVYDYGVRNYVTRAANATYTQGNYKAGYVVERFGNIINIKEDTIPQRSIIKLVNNTGTDVATNYNTTTLIPVVLSDIVFSSNNTNNNITINAARNTFTTIYNGYIELDYILNFTCATTNTSLAIQIINTTTGVRDLASIARVLVANGNNVITATHNTIMACAPGNTFQIQANRFGTSTVSTTLVNSTSIKSNITAKTFIL